LPSYEDACPQMPRRLATSAGAAAAAAAPPTSADANDENLGM